MSQDYKVVLRKALYFLAFLVAIWWLFLSSSVLDERSLDSDTPDDNILFRDFKLNNPREGWELFADECLKNDTNRTTIFKTVKIVQTEKDGTVTTLTSRKGSINENHKRVDLQDDVVAHHMGGARKIFTERLLYSYKMKVGSSPGKVKIEEDGSVCTGNSMDFNAGSSTGKVVGDVHVIVNPDAPSGKAGKATSETAPGALKSGTSEIGSAASGPAEPALDSPAADRAATRGAARADEGAPKDKVVGISSETSGLTAGKASEPEDEPSKPMRGIGPRSWLLDEEEKKTKTEPAQPGGGLGGK